MEQFSKLSVGGATTRARVTGKNENLRKTGAWFVRITSTIILEASRKKMSTTAFYPM